MITFSLPFAEDGSPLDLSSKDYRSREQNLHRLHQGLLADGEGFAFVVHRQGANSPATLVISDIHGAQNAGAPAYLDVLIAATLWVFPPGILTGARDGAQLYSARKCALGRAPHDAQGQLRGALPIFRKAGLAAACFDPSASHHARLAAAQTLRKALQRAGLA